MKLLECVPNFSEGHSKEVLEALEGVVAETDGAWLLAREMDPDHHRAVLTLAGTVDGVAEAAFGLARMAAARIDLRRHAGVHRRCGALDVCPFVPMGGTTMAEAVAVAEAVAERVSAELAVPTFLYARAARRPEREVLGFVRNRGFEALRTSVGRDLELRPDFGAPEVHPSAGATSVGARSFLIAFNVNLASEDLQLAKNIARAVRESSGGLPAVQAMGFTLATEACVQVSTNILDFERTSVTKLYDAIAEHAAAAGVSVDRSELIGLAPEAAVNASVATHVRLPDFDPDRDLVERRLAAVRQE